MSNVSVNNESAKKLVVRHADKKFIKQLKESGEKVGEIYGSRIYATGDKQIKTLMKALIDFKESKGWISKQNSLKPEKQASTQLNSFLSGLKAGEVLQVDGKKSKVRTSNSHNLIVSEKTKNKHKATIFLGIPKKYQAMEFKHLPKADQDTIWKGLTPKQKWHVSSARAAEEGIKH